MTERRFVIRSDWVRTNVRAWLDKVPLDTEVIFRPFVEKRSHVANARLWALHTKAAEVTGYSPEEMHEHALCRHFGFTEREVRDPFTGEIQTKRTPNKRSSQRDKREFGQFMEATEAWYIQDFGVWLDQEAA